MATSLTFKDIGIRPRLRRRRAAGWAALWAAALLALALVQGAADRAARPPVPEPPPEARTVGVFTGEFVDGMPVYRLPSITVVGKCDTEFARIHRDVAVPRVNPKQG